VLELEESSDGGFCFAESDGRNATWVTSYGQLLAPEAQVRLPAAASPTIPARARPRPPSAAPPPVSARAPRPQVPLIRAGTNRFDATDGFCCPDACRPPPPRTKWTRRVPHPVLIGHAASLTPY